jgi:hypothetical protein
MSGVTEGIFITVIGGLILAAILALVKWGANTAQKGGQTARVKHWLAENWAYVRGGFRWNAVLDCDHDSSVGRAHICKRVPPLVTDENDVRVRLGELKSRPFQSRKSFAWQVYATFVPFCAQHGWHPLELHGWSAPGLIGHRRVWSVDFDQGHVVIAPGWSPITAIQQEPKVNLAYLPPQLRSDG